MVGYIFGGNTGETPESLKRKREIAQALLGLQSAPRTVGEGLNALGGGIASAILNHRADKAEKAGQESANAAFSPIIAALGGGGAFPAAPGMSGAGGNASQPTASPVAATDVPTQRVASAFAASEPDSGTGDRVTTAANRAGVSSETARKNPMELASSLLGKGEIPDRATIQEYMKNGGVNLDPATTAWCAAFVNASLGQAGIKGTGSNMARSFLKWGQGVDTPVAGDIGVLPRGNPNGPYGHVGFVEGYDPKTGMVTLLAGNQGNAVSEKQFPAGQFLGFRRAPSTTPAVAATNAMASNSPAVPPLPAPVNVPDMPVASQPQPVQVAQNVNPNQMSDADALKLLGASPVKPGQGVSIADLLRTASNPWLNKNQSAVVQALLASKLKQQDPSAQLDMRYKQAQIENLRSLAHLRNDPNARNRFGNSVIWGQDADGNWVAMQPTSAGGLVPAQVPDGIKLSPPGVSNLNLGTEFGIRDRNGQVVNTVPIDNAGKAADTAFGKGQGEARSTFASMSAKLPGLETVVTKLDDLANKATYTTAGQMLDLGRKEIGMQPREAAVARTEYMATVANQILPLLRDTFGAQFTAREGDTLMSTMGDPNKTPAEKQAVLKAFIEQKKRDIAALANQTGQTPPADAAPAAPKIRRYNPQTGELE